MSIKLVTESLIEYRLLENVQEAKAIIKKMNISENDPRFIELKYMLGLTPDAIKDRIKQRPGYIKKFTEWLFIDNVKFQVLKDLYELIKKNPQVSFDINDPKLPDDVSEVEALYDYITFESSRLKVKSTLKSIPSLARKKVTPEIEKLLSNSMEYERELKSFFSKKGGRYSFESSQKFYDDIEKFIENLHGDFNEKSMLEKLSTAGKEGIDYNIIHSSPEILVVQILSYKMSCEVGSVEWCLSTSEGHWDSYVRYDTNQFFIYDFTKSSSDIKSRIGVTVGPNLKNGKSNYKYIQYKDDSEVPPAYLENLLKKI